LKNGSNFLTKRQTTILSAAAIIMVMIAASRILGLVRNRVLAQFFSAETLSLYFAAFRLPEVVFEVLVLGTLSSAFIPTFAGYLSRRKEQEGWQMAATCLNLALIIFVVLAALIFIFGGLIYRVVAAGFAAHELDQIVSLARILILAQGFFVLSYFLTGILESLQRFLVPAVAPLFYNLGIILGTIFLSSSLGIYGPAIGATIGAFFHFIIQLPLALYLGFKPRRTLAISPGVKKVGRLAAPRIIELSFLQIGKTVELFLASLVSTAAYTYFTFANSLQFLPISLFGTSIAKASLPAMAYQVAKKRRRRFKDIFLSSFNEILFLVVPCAVFLAVLRVPLVRLVFGAARFTWTSTVETSQVLSAFSLGVSFQALVYLLARAFYALQDTKTPVKISVLAIFLNIVLSFIFTLVFRWPIWGLALAYSIGLFLQTIALLYLLNKKVGGLDKKRLFIPFIKILFSALLAGGVMFFMLKVFDRSAWDKRLSFLGRFGLVLPTSFEKFILDTRYTVNLVYLTLLVALVGGGVYLLVARVLKVESIAVFSRLLVKFKFQKPKASLIRPLASEKKEAMTVEDEEP
jgi:putative peptidoglycan lipid II flippase